MFTHRTSLALAVTLVAVFVLAGCSSNGSDAGTDAEITPLDPFNAAILDLSQRTGIAVEEITTVSVQSKEWPNSCLGLPQPEEVCAEVITHGNEVALEADGKRYVYRTDRATNVRLEEEAPP